MVYLIVDRKNNLGKIGVSSSVRARLTSLQTSNPFPCEIYSCMSGGRDIEAGLKEEFNEYKVSGEWFNLNDKILMKFMFGRIESYNHLGQKYRSIIPNIGDHVYLSDSATSDLYDEQTSTIIGDPIITNIKSSSNITVTMQVCDGNMISYDDLSIWDLYFKCRVLNINDIPTIDELALLPEGNMSTRHWLIKEAISTNKLLSFDGERIVASQPKLSNY